MKLRAGFGPKRGAVCLFTLVTVSIPSLWENFKQFFFFFWNVEEKEKTQLGDGRRFHWVMSHDRIVSSQESIRGRFLSTGNKRALLSPRCHCSWGAFFSPADTFRLTVFHYFKCNCHGLPFCFGVLIYTCISQPLLVQNYTIWMLWSFSSSVHFSIHTFWLLTNRVIWTSIYFKDPL